MVDVVVQCMVCGKELVSHLEYPNKILVDRCVVCSTKRINELEIETQRLHSKLEGIKDLCGKTM